MGWSNWKIAWDGDERRPEGVIPTDLLPCDSFMYKYVIHKDFPISAAPVARQFQGLLTNHIDKYYKESIYMYWTAFTTEIPGSGLCFFSLMYDNRKEKRVFYKWMNIENLSGTPYFDKIQKEQTLLFEFTKQELNEVALNNITHKSFFTATAGNQNVAKDLLKDEYLEIVDCPDTSYKDKKFLIVSNDGYGKVVVDNGGIDLTKLPNDTKFRIKPKYAWVEIGKKEKNEYTWYGEEKYSFSGDSGFVLTSAISGIYTAQDRVMLDGEWFSNIINIHLPQGSRIWIDQHTAGIPFLGPRWAVYWIRTTKRDYEKISAIKKKDCYVYLIAYTDDNGNLCLKEIDRDKRRSRVIVVDKSARYVFPNVVQFDWLDLWLVSQREEDLYVSTDFSRAQKLRYLERYKDEVDDRKMSYLTARSIRYPICILAENELFLICKGWKGDGKLHKFLFHIGTKDDLKDTVDLFGNYPLKNKVKLQYLGDLSSVLNTSLTLPSSRKPSLTEFTNEYKQFGVDFCESTYELLLWFLFSNKVYIFKSSLTSNIAYYVNEIDIETLYYHQKRYKDNLCLVFSDRNDKNKLFYAILQYSDFHKAEEIEVGDDGKIAVKIDKEIKYNSYNELPSDVKPPIDMLCDESTNELLIATFDNIWVRKADFKEGWEPILK